MKRTIPTILISAFMLLLVGCSGNPAQTTVPEIEFVEYEELQCPKLKTASDEQVINIVNTEIEAQFQRLLDESDNGNIRTFTSATETMLFILLKVENEVSYGTDGEVWGICYDYINQTILPCGAYLTETGHSYSDISQTISTMLREDGAYEHISIPYFYIDSNSDLILVVEALEHPMGADPWERLYYYSVDSNSFVDSPWSP